MGRFTDVINNTEYSVSPDVSRDPDQLAKDKTLSDQTGLPVDYVERNREKVVQIKKNDIDFSKYSGSTVGDKLSDPTFSNLAQDDLNNLRNVELGMRSLRDWGIDIGSSFAYGSANLLDSAQELSRIHPAGYLWRNTIGKAYEMIGLEQPQDYAKYAAQYIQEKSKGFQSEQMGQAQARVMQADGFFDTLYQAAKTPEFLPTFVAEQAPSFLAPMGMTGLAAKTVATKSGLASIALSTSALMEAQGAATDIRDRIDAMTDEDLASNSPMYQELINDGATPEEARAQIKLTAQRANAMFASLIATGAGKISGASDLMADLVTGKMGGNILTRILTGAAREGAEEILTEGGVALSGNIAVSATADETQTATAGVGQQAALGLLGGVTMGGAFGAVGNRNVSDQLNQMREAAEKSNLKRRSPEEFRSFLQDVDPDTNIFIPASAFDDVELTPVNPTLEKIISQYQSAKQLDGDIVIPASDVLTDIPPDVFAKFSPYMRINADGVADVQGKPDLTELFDKVNKEADIANESKAFQENLTNQIVNTGRAQKSEAKKYAAVLGARLETLAIDKGLTFQETIDTYVPGLRVVGPDVEVGDGAILDQAQKEGYEGQDRGEAEEWVRAKAKGLDMSKEARIERAKSMGFDVDSILYHGTKAGDFESFSRGIAYFSDSPEVASDFSVYKSAATNPNVFPVYAKGDFLEVDADYGREGIREAEQRFGRDVLGLTDSDFPNGTEIYDYAKEQGYDGVLFKSVVDDPGGPNIARPSNVYSIFYSKNIRSINAAFDPDYKDSPNLLAQGEDTDRSLAVVHNLSSENIIAANELGGLAAPSLAVMRTDKGFGSFGDITLIAKPELLNDKNIRTFESDVYSPRQPRATYDIDRAKTDKFRNEVLESVGNTDLRLFYSDDLQENGVDDMIRSEALQYHWLKENGKAPRLKKKKVDPFIAKAAKIIKPGVSPYDYVRDPKIIKLSLDKGKAAYEKRKETHPDIAFKLVGSSFTDETMTAPSESQVSGLVNEAVAYNKKGGIDSGSLRNDIAKKMRTQKAQKEFKKYAEEKFNELVKGKKLFKGYTDSGNRRYVEYSMDNVLKEMTKKIRSGEDFFYGPGNVRSRYSKELKTLEDIKSNREKIISDAEFQELKDESMNVFTEALEDLKPYYRFDADGWGYFNDAGSALSEGPKGIAEAFNLDEEGRKIVTDLIDYLVKMPTSYFEAKTQRRVDFSEFDTAIVPKDADPEAVKILRDAGVKIRRYDSNIDGDRDRVIGGQSKLLFQSAYHGTPHQFDKFSLDAIGTGEGVQAYGYGLYFAGKKEIAEFYRDTLSGDFFRIANTGGLFDPATLQHLNVRSLMRNGKLDEAIAKAESISGSDSPVADMASADLAVLKSIKEQGGLTRAIGNTYQVDIPEDSELMDWDRAMSEQPDIMKKLGIKEKDAYLDTELTPKMSGQEVYDRLSRGRTNRGVNGKQQASEYLDSLGIPGLRYLDGVSRGGEEGTHNYVIWDENRVTIEAINDELRQAQEYAQKERGLISISDKEIIIKLTEASDLSTFIHEAGHLFLEIETRIAKIDGVSESQQKMLDWLGVKSFEYIGTDQHEKFARGFEAYALEGKAPSKALVEVFRSFSRWLKKVYASMRSLNVELNDDIRQFFDRMLATDVAIKEAELLHQYDALFKDAKSAGMTEAEFADYQANLAKANDKGSETLQAKLLSELTRQTQKWWNDELKQEKAKAMDVIDQQPLYKAILFMNGKLQIEGIESVKMDTASVKGILDVKDMPKQLRGLTTKGGVSPDEMAALFDFSSGHELVNRIASSPTLKEAVNDIANQSMVEKHGDILNDGSLEEEATLAAHNEERGKLVLSELRALNRKQGKETINRDALKASAKEMIGRTRLKDVHPGKYRTAEVRNAKEAAAAQAKGDTETAAQAKLKQAANFYLYREAMDAKKKEESWRRHLSSVKARKYNVKEVNPDYVRTIKMLASVYDFRKNPNGAELLGIAQWIKAQQDAETDVAPQIMDIHLSEAIKAAETGEVYTPPHYRDMTLDELQGVYDMVKHLRWVGGQLSENEKAKLKKLYDETANSIREHGGDLVPVPREIKARHRALSGLRQFGQDHLALANHIEELDGFEKFGPTFEVIYKSVIQSSNTELKMRRETAEKMNNIFKEFSSKDFAEGRDEKTIKTDDGRDFTLSRRGRVMVGLYWGSPESREALMKGDNLTLNDVNKILNQLSDKELDLIEDIWSVNESFWPELAKVSKSMTGMAPAKVEHVSYGVRNRVMKGGYMRLFYAYDQRDSVQTVDTEGAKITRSGSRIATQTKHGARHERVGSGGRKVDLSITNIFRAVDEVIHDISFAETARDTSRAMRSPEISGAIIDHYGKEKYESMQSALEGVIAGNVSNSHPINRFIRHFRTAATYGMLGYSIRNFIQQPVALTNIFGKVGEVETTKAIFDFVINRNKWGKFVQDRSEFMRNRTALVNREVAEILNKVGGKVMSSRLKEHAFDLQTMGDSMVAYPGWLAAYRKGLNEFGSEEKAIIYADEAISATIGSGLMKDMSPMLQGSGRLAQAVGPEMLKNFTFMGSYFNVVGRLIRDANRNSDFKSVRGVADYTRQMTWYLAAPAILSALLVGDGPDDEEFWALWAAKATAQYGVSSVFLLRDIVSAVGGFSPSSTWTRAVTSGVRLANQGYGIATGEKEADLEAAAKALRTLGYLYPLPGSGSAARTLEYIGSQEAGNEGDFNPYAALIIGKDRD